MLKLAENGLVCAAIRLKLLTSKVDAGEVGLLRAEFIFGAVDFLLAAKCVMGGSGICQQAFCFLELTGNELTTQLGVLLRRLSTVALKNVYRCIGDSLR
jgi:hypothetical protein